MVKTWSKPFIKVVLFVARIQNMCRKEKFKSLEIARFERSNNIRSCNDAINVSTETKEWQQILNAKTSTTMEKSQQKCLHWPHDNSKNKSTEAKAFGQRHAAIQQSSVCKGRSVSWTFFTDVHRYRSGLFHLQQHKISESKPDNLCSIAMNFTEMTKPYSLVVNSSHSTDSSSSSTFDVQNRCQGKNFTVVCNSVMGSSKRLNRRLIRQGSASDLRSGNGKSTFRPPMLRTHTADNSDLKFRCTSDENVAHFEHASRSPRLHKFAKRKSSADLLDVTTVSERCKHLASSSAVAGSTKIAKKQLEKLKVNMKHLLELFTAVEQDDIGKVRVMIQDSEMDINGTNMDDFSLLDVALMLNHNEVALLLLQHGCQQNPRLSVASNRMKHIQKLLDVAHVRLTELSAQTIQLNGTKGIEKQICSSESRLHMLKKMRTNFENMRVPLPPTNSSLQVTSSTSLEVTFDPPDQTLSVITKYKIEWSLTNNFSEIDGSVLIEDVRRSRMHLLDLDTGSTYFVRIAAGNYKGFGEPVLTQPICETPSSWRDVEGKSERCDRLSDLTELHREIQILKNSEVWDKTCFTNDFRRKKSSLKTYFTGGAKLVKNLKKGFYLATIFYKDDKVLCTTDECLPVVEVDENPPSCINGDFQWFMKLSYAWDEMKSMQLVDFDKRQFSANLAFRSKLLDAAASMQSALGANDLGRLHYSPLIDNRALTILVTVRNVQDMKSIQTASAKWMSINKLFLNTKVISSDSISCGSEILTANLLNFLNYYETSTIPLSRGLYVCYMKLHSSMNQISLVVPDNQPSTLPFVHMRDNPHVSKEEWSWLKTLNENGTALETGSFGQMIFQRSLASATKTLLKEVGVRDAQSHRVYRLDVIEVHSDVSLILLVPSHQDVCTPPGQQKCLVDDKRGCLALPVSMFEVSHLCTYQPDFLAIYCRLSVFLDFYTSLVQQLQRQTLEDVETKTYRQVLSSLNGFQQRLDDVWKNVRWVTPVVSAARDKRLESGLPLNVLFECNYNEDADPSLNEANENVAASSWTLSSQKRNSTDASDECEDSSDVGYHSDQSLDKPSLKNAIVVHKSVLSAKFGDVKSSSVDNPNYELVEKLSRTRRLDGLTTVAFSPYASSSTGNFLTVKTSVQRPTEQKRADSLDTVLNLTSELQYSHGQLNIEMQQDYSVSSSSNYSPYGPKRAVRDQTGISSASGHKLVRQNPVDKIDKNLVGTENASGILRVYAAYPCGLSKGTSVTLQVSNKTSSKEITALVVQQLNKLSQCKTSAAPFYEDEVFHQFCLVAVIGARERCLRDDFFPLDLQNPWNKGKLFVRRRHDLLAALEYGNEAKV